MVPLSALFMIRFRLWVSSVNASLSFLVRLSLLFCLYFDSSKNSNLILCRYVYRAPLSVSLSGFGVNFGFCWKGSRALAGFLFVFFSFISNFNFIL